MLPNGSSLLDSSDVFSLKPISEERQRRSSLEISETGQKSIFLSTLK